MKIFLDDVREPYMCANYMYHRIGVLNPVYLEDWFVVRNYDEFVDAITKHIDEIEYVSFDHDLSDEHYDPSMNDNDDLRYNNLYNEFKEKTGYECAKWMLDFYKEKGKELPFIFVHSMNPIGTQNIINVFKK